MDHVGVVSGPASYNPKGSECSERISVNGVPRISVDGVPIASVLSVFNFKLAEPFKKIRFGVECRGKDGKTRTLSFNLEVSNDDYNWMLENEIIQKRGDK